MHQANWEAVARRMRTEIGITYNMNHLTKQLAINNTYVYLKDKLIHTQDNYFDTIVYIQQ